METKNDQAVLELMVRGTLVSITKDVINNMAKLISNNDDEIYVEQYSLPTGQFAYSILGNSRAYVKNGLSDPCKENEYLDQDTLVLIVGMTNRDFSVRSRFGSKNDLTFMEAESNPYQVKLYFIVQAKPYCIVPEESDEVEEALLYDDEVPSLLIKRL